MSTEYAYNKVSIVDLDQLLVDIAASAMTDKGVDYLRWDENPPQAGDGLCVFWTLPLSGADKTLLDALVSPL